MFLGLYKCKQAELIQPVFLISKVHIDLLLLNKKTEPKRISKTVFLLHTFLFFIDVSLLFLN